MSAGDLPPVPQSGTLPLLLPAEQEQRLLARRRKEDQTDPFATDPDEEIRRLGRLALRRDVPHPHDYLALGDLCARRSLVESEQRLLVYYVGKALYAYRRAAELAEAGSDAARTAQAISARYADWLLEVARAAPTRRNIAVALWAVADMEAQGHMAGLPDEAHVLALWYVSPPSADLTPPPDPTPTPVDEAHSTAIYPGTQATLAGESLEADAALLSLAGPEDEASSLSETRSDKSEIFRLELESTSTGSATMPDILVAPARHKEGTDFDFGDRIDGRYEVAQVLRGGMGIVYLCYDHEERCSVAIKTFQSRLLTNETAVARFTQEARTWIMLEKHRHIVQARRVQKFDGRPHIILEHITGPEGLGPDLRSWIRHRRIDLPQALDFALQIALGMQHATRRVPGLVHRDLKPANILVRHDGIAKVTDFGLVRSMDADQSVSLSGDDGPWASGLTRVGAIVGTPPYMAPEQCRAELVDMRADIYAFGCVLFEMLTGRTVFEAKLLTEWVHAHLNLLPAFPDSAAQVPAPVRELTLACLAKDPADRPQSWGELVDALRALIGEITGAPPETNAEGPALEISELMDKGYSLTELGFAEEALVAYDRALALDPHSAWAWARKGRTLRLLGRYDEALAAYDRALALNPHFAWAWTGKGQVLERLGQTERALAAHQTATELHPDNVWAWYNQAEVLYTRRDYEGAMRVLDRALHIDPHHAESWAKRGQVLRTLERLPEALNAYNRALELNPRYAWAWNGKGLACAALGRWEEARLCFARAVELSPDDVWFWHNLGDALLQLGRWEEAVTAFNRALQLDPTHQPSREKRTEARRHLDGEE